MYQFKLQTHAYMIYTVQLIAFSRT